MLQVSRKDTIGGDRLAWRSSLIVGAVALAAYLVLAPAVTGDKDAAEFTLVLGTGGVAHPTGYPLYTLLGHPFVKALHAMGASWEYAANAWSALGGALAIMLLHRLGRRLAPGDGPAAGIAAWLPVLVFGLNPIWTYETTLAETGSWHVAWAAGASLLALRLLEAIGAAGAAGAQTAAWRRGALAWGFACGLGLSHHLTALLLLAPLTVALLRAAGRRRSTVDVLALFAAGAVIPLLSYAHVAWRAFHPAAGQWPVLAPTWRGILDHVSAAQYRGYIGGFRPSPGQAGHLVRYVYPFVGVAALAMVQAIRSAAAGPRRSLLWAMAAGCVIQVAVILAYGVPDPGSYFLPVLGLGLVALAPAAAGSGWLGRNATMAMVMAVAVFGALDGYWIKVNIDRRGLYVRHEKQLRDMWSSIPAAPSFVLWYNDMVNQLLIWQELEGEKPDVHVYNQATLTHPYPRSRFARTFGFDPDEGLVIPAALKHDPDALGAALADGITASINRQTNLPVIVIGANQPTVRLMKKQGTP